jgi:radical SAM protein with 4Fe4S-binding SPASM domain
MFQSSGVSHRPAPHPSGRGYFFSKRHTVDAGIFVARFQVLLPRDLPADAFVSFEVVAWLADGGHRFLARTERRCDAGLVENSDNILLMFQSDARLVIEYRCYASHDCANFHLRALKVKHADRGRLEDWSYSHATARWPLERLRNVIIGNSSVCNARCTHCPTSLHDNAMSGQKVMPLDLHEKLITGVRETGLPIDGQLAYGLFAEPLLDPTLMQKVMFTRAEMPGQRVVINTNGGPFNPRIHERLVDYVTAVSVHMEAIDPDLYEQLMTPLKATRTVPRVIEIARIWGKRAKLAVPIHNRNADQFARLKDWWDSVGGGEAIALQYSNRCSWSPASTSLLLWPTPGDCHQEVTGDLIVDHDGKVLTCCHDFTRGNEIGDLTVETVAETLSSDARRDNYVTFGRQEWNKYESCSSCLVGDVAKMREALAAQPEPAAATRGLHPALSAAIVARNATRPLTNLLNRIAPG